MPKNKLERYSIWIERICISIFIGIPLLTFLFLLISYQDLNSLMSALSSGKSLCDGNDSHWGYCMESVQPITTEVKMTYSWFEKIYFLLIFFLSDIFYMTFVYYLYKLFHSYRKGDVFTDKQISLYKRISISLMLIFVYQVIYPTLEALILSPKVLFISFELGGGNLSILISSMVVYAISLVMKLALELDNEVKLTI